MNLVQIQERLKDMPVPSLMQYANGGNPMVPPYLALAELKRRETMTQSAQAQQAMQQGQQPSVKEQVEQAAGLAGLQRQMQAQGMQNLMAQVRPQGVPENTPQPSRQPESEGVAGLPTGEMYNFRNGGIVAFAAGDLVESYPVLSVDEMRARYKQLLRANKPIEANEMLKQIKSKEPEEYRTISVPVAPMDEAPQRVQTPQPTQAGIVVPEQVARSTPEQYATAQSEFTNITPQEVLRQIMTISDPTERAAALNSLQRPTEKSTLAPAVTSPASTVVSAPAPQGLASIPGADEARDMLLAAMRKQATPESAAEQERKLAGLYGLDKQYGEDRTKRIQAMESERQKALEDRGMERLMRVMGGIAGRGLVGAGPAYLQSVETERAADEAFRKQMDELLGGVEEKRRAEQLAGMTRAQQEMNKQRELGLGAAEKVSDWQRRREDEMFKVQLEQQLKMMQPNEAMVLMNVVDDIRKRNPNMSLEDAVARGKEAMQGATPAVARERIDRQREADWNKIQSDILAKQNYAKQGITTFQQYKASLEDQPSVTAPANRPPLSSFKG